MKITLTKSDLVALVAKAYQPPAGCEVGAIEIREYRDDEFCEIAFEAQAKPAANEPQA